MLDLNAQPDGLRIPDEMLGGVVDPELEEYIRDLICCLLYTSDAADE